MIQSYFDAHCDTLWRAHTENWSLEENPGHVDLRRLSAYAPMGQVFALYEDSANLPEAERWPYIRARAGEFLAAKAAHPELMSRCCLSVEGAELLDCDEGKLADAWEKGVRMVNLTWNFENALSGSNAEAPGKGLTVRGRSFVCKMQQLGMIVDVSHLSDPGFWDVAELSQAAGTPFIASHSNARALCPHKRNLTDEQFTAIIKSRGVAGLNLCDKFLAGRPTLDDAAAHIEHFLALGGEENVAIGGDWDGCDLCPGVEQITDIGLLYERLLRRNYSETLVQAIFYNNLMRVVREVCTI